KAQRHAAALGDRLAREPRELERSLRAAAIQRSERFAAHEAEADGEPRARIEARVAREDEEGLAPRDGGAHGAVGAVGAGLAGAHRAQTAGLEPVDGEAGARLAPRPE